MYTTRDSVRRVAYNERDYLLADRFYPGELGLVIMLAIASLLVWSLCIWGITNDSKEGMYSLNNEYGYNSSNSTGYNGSSAQ